MCDKPLLCVKDCSRLSGCPSEQNRKEVLSFWGRHSVESPGRLSRGRPGWLGVGPGSPPHPPAVYVLIQVMQKLDQTSNYTVSPRHPKPLAFPLMSPLPSSSCSSPHQKLPVPTASCVLFFNDPLPSQYSPGVTPFKSFHIKPPASRPPVSMATSLMQGQLCRGRAGGSLSKKRGNKW